MTRQSVNAMPGFVDLQVNGFVGVDFSCQELTADDCRHACAELFKRGTAAFLATIITSPLDRLRRNLSLISSVLDEDEFSGRVLGIHLEGPFLSYEHGTIGAHNPEWVIEPNIDMFDRLQDWAGGKIRMLTISAEPDGAADLARHVSDSGVCVSMGHHLASNDALRRLVRAGATSLTHLGNGLPNILNRRVNPVWSSLANDSLMATFIADGHHLSPEILKSFIRAKGIERTVIISDAAPAAGLPPGTYQNMGNTVVLEESGRLYNPETLRLVGSSSTLLQCMNYLAGLDIMSFDSLRMVGFTNPLKLIGLSADDVDTSNVLRFDPDKLRFELIR